MCARWKESKSLLGCGKGNHAERCECSRWDVFSGRLIVRHMCKWSLSAVKESTEMGERHIHGQSIEENGISFLSFTRQATFGPGWLSGSFYPLVHRDRQAHDSHDTQIQHTQRHLQFLSKAALLIHTDAHCPKVNIFWRMASPEN